MHVRFVEATHVSENVTVLKSKAIGDLVSIPRKGDECRIDGHKYAVVQVLWIITRDCNISVDIGLLPQEEDGID